MVRGADGRLRHPRVRRTSSPSATPSRSSGCARPARCCLGLTNMPPMANGGMQRGLYGRAESPYNADYLTAAFASGSSNGVGHRDRRELRRVRARRGDLVERARPGIEQRAVRLHALARRDLGARQLAARAHDGRRRAARPHHGRPARGARRHRRRRRRHPRRPLAAAAVGADPPRVPTCARTPTRRWRSTAGGARRQAIRRPAMYIGDRPRCRNRRRRPASAVRPGSASSPRPSVLDAVERRHEATSKRRAPRSWRWTFPLSPTTKATVRVRRRSSTAASCTPEFLQREMWDLTGVGVR